MSERVLEPLEMSDTEIIDFFSEYCLSAGHSGSDWWHVLLEPWKSVRGNGFRDAVRLAAAKHKEANRDF